MQQIKKELRQLLDKTYKTDADKNWFNQYAIGNNLTDEQKIEFLKLPVNERNQRLQDYEFQKGGEHIGTYIRRQQQQQESSEESEYVDNKSSEKSDVSRDERSDSYQFRDEEKDQYTYEQLQNFLLSKQQFQTMLSCPYFSDLIPYMFLLVTLDEKDGTLLSVNQKSKESNVKHKQMEKQHDKNQNSGLKYYSLVQLEPYIYHENNQIIKEFNPINHSLDNIYFTVQAPKEHTGSILHINNIGEELALIYKPLLYEKQYEKRYDEFLSPMKEIKQFIFQQRYVPGQTLERQQKLLTQDQLMDIMDYALYGMNESNALYCINTFFNYPGNLKSTHITECMDQCILRIKGLGYLVKDKHDMTDEQKDIVTKVQQTEVALSDDILMEAKDVYDDDVYQLITKFNSRLIEEDKRYNDFLNKNRVITIDSRFMKANDADRAIDKARQLIRQYLNKNSAESTLKSNNKIDDLMELIQKEQQNFLMNASPKDKFLVNLTEKTIQINQTENQNTQKPPIYLTSPVYQCILLKQTSDVKDMIDPIQIAQYDNSDIVTVEFVQKRMQENNRVIFFFDIQ